MGKYIHLLFSAKRTRCLITLRDGNDVSYITQVGTGNYNERTSKLYTDLTLMTADRDFGSAVGENADNNAEASDEGSINTNSSDSVSATTGVNVSESSESKADTAATKEAE